MTQRGDGLGQSLLDDIRWAIRFRRLRRRPVPWRAPTPEESRATCAHPVLGRFGDDLVAVANWEERRWLVLENGWHGWPDPPRYVLFVLDRDDAVWTASGFEVWPSAWRRP